MQHDLTGKRFGKLLAVQCVGSNKSRKRVWLCRCDCGGQSMVTANNLRTGNTKSCACGQREAGCRNLIGARNAHRHQISLSYRQGQQAGAGGATIGRCQDGTSPLFGKSALAGVPTSEPTPAATLEPTPPPLPPIYAIRDASG